MKKCSKKNESENQAQYSQAIVNYTMQNFETDIENLISNLKKRFKISKQNSK